MMQWERKQINKEIGKLAQEIHYLEEEIQSLKNQLEVTRIMLRRAENRLEKAEHDRDRYKRRIKVLQGNIDIDAKDKMAMEVHRERVFACAKQIEFYTKIIEEITEKKEG